MDAPQPPAPQPPPSQDTEPGRSAPQGDDLEWGDGDTLFDAQVESLRAAAQAARAAEPGAEEATGPTEDTADNDTTARIPRAAAEEPQATPRAAEPAPRDGKRPVDREERPTALLDTVPMPPEGLPATPPPRWAPSSEPTVGMARHPSAPDDERSLLPTLLTAAAAVLLGILLGMAILRIHAGRGTPSLALEGSQQVQQLLHDGEQLLRAGQREEARKRAAAALAIEPENARARQLRQRSEAPAP